MLSARIELRGEELFCADTGEGGASTVRPLTQEALARLRGWAENYDNAVRSGALPALVEIGRDVAAFLDEGDRWLDRVLGGTGEIVVDVVVPGRPEQRERILLDVPWELLAPNGLFLASDNERLFRVTRRLGGAGLPAAPAYRDLALLFMAAEVDGQGILSYEQEEAAILQATKGFDLNLSVEESGAIEFLTQRIAQDGPFDALHLSCHGNIVNGEPILFLESPEGREKGVNITRFSDALGEEGRKPALIFLSACRTGERGAAAASFVQSLVRSGVLNAVGWDGSVYDDDAIGFAEIFYKELAAGRSIAYAAAQGRRALLRTHLAEPTHGRHWHLARVYAGPRGGGALCSAGRPRRPFRRDAGFKEFLDIKQRRVPVAAATEFVGRRRQAQRILRAFRDREGAGVLIHGIGSQGKSSLAARIANRMPGHDTVVIFQRYDALAVFEALRSALPPRLQGEFDQMWRQQVMNSASALQNALVDMLEGPFRAADPEKRAKPVLLIIDDLEQILETPKPGEANTPVKTAYNVTLASIIGAFRDAETESRLLLTSRYTFALSDARGDHLAARLVTVQLPPMDETQCDKHIRAAAQLARGEPGMGAAADESRAALESRIKKAAGGNPGLQAILARPLLAGEINVADRAVAAVESYLKSGKVPSETGAAAEFFEHVSLTAFKDMLTPQETQQLRAATLFLVPVPQAVLAVAGAAASVKEPERAIERLQGLGLIDVYLSAGVRQEVAVNPLTRPLARALSETETARLAEKVLVPLYSYWKEQDGGLPANPRGLEVALLALRCHAPADIVNASALAGVVFLFHRMHKAQLALDLVLSALAALDRAKAIPDLHLLRHGADCAHRLGRTDIQEALLERGLRINNGDPRARAMLLSATASRLLQTGEIGVAEKLLHEATSIFGLLGDVRGRGITIGQIADILQARGQLDAALKIRMEEELPVYDHLGDVRSRAVTMGEIADIFEVRGQFDEALKIRTEEQLPVFERLGDMRARAITLGRIADNLQARGRFHEALRIRTEEELAVYERLGDLRERAVTIGKIAAILHALGELDGALKLLQQRVLPAMERLGAVSERAVTIDKIAEIFLARGQLDEALRYQMEALPVYEKLGATRDLLIARTNQAYTRLLRNKEGDRDEARRLLRLALDDAERLELPQASLIEQLLEQADRGNLARRDIVAELADGVAVSATKSVPPAPPPPAEATTRGFGAPAEPGQAPHPEMQAEKAEYVVWYGTNRRPNDPNDAGKGYSKLRDIVVHYGSCRVFIPKSHKIGSIGSPWWKRLLTRTDDRVRLLAIDDLHRSDYWNRIAVQIAAMDADERCAVIFVHGYNVSFQQAAQRAAQIGFDLSIKGAMAFFSWPSQGSARGYSADEATIEASEGVIADFMTDFAERSGANAVHVIAHSMGNRGVLRAVNRIAAKARRRTGKAFGQIILAAADVDADVFQQLSAAYAEVANRTTLYVSKRDRAVEASRWLHHFARAGLMPPTLVVPGIDTINVTNVDLTMLGHGYIAEARDVLIDMHALITGGTPPGDRFGLREAKNEEGKRYWLIGA
jgi:esterase/lipase superfamily enzyme